MSTSCLWFIGQAGIILEVIGAGLVVYFAYGAKKKIHHLKTDLDKIQEAVDSILEDVGSQFRKQAVGFILLLLGLAMQFVGNF